MSDRYCKLFPEFPGIPQDLIDHELSQLDTAQTHPFSFDERQGLVRDDYKTTSAQTRTWWCSDKLVNWANTELVPKIKDVFGQEYTDVKIFYREIGTHDDVNFMIPHFDPRRELALVYQIVDSDGELTFWQNGTRDIFTRTKDDPVVVKDYSELKKLYSIKTPTKIWYSLNPMVYHSVENLQSVRKNFQFSIRSAEFKVFEQFQTMELRH